MNVTFNSNPKPDITKITSIKNGFSSIEGTVVPRQQAPT